MLPQLYRAIEHRMRITGIITLQDLSVSLGVSDDTIMRAVKAGTFPEPLTRFGRKWWHIAVIRQYFQQEAEAVQQQALQDRARLDTKVQALFGGEPHGRRP